MTTPSTVIEAEAKRVPRSKPVPLDCWAVWLWCDAAGKWLFDLDAQTSDEAVVTEQARRRLAQGQVVRLVHIVEEPAGNAVECQPTPDWERWHRKQHGWKPQPGEGKGDGD